MFEGKNIHFSEGDHRALCSFSVKVCRQRRLNGFAFCLRHILEDPSAPFKQCVHQAKHRKQCSNPIPQATPSQFCSCHSNGVSLKQPSKRLPDLSVQNGFTTSSLLKAPLDDPSDDPYAFHDADPLTPSKEVNINRQMNAISIAKLYPELAEKLERVKTKSCEVKSAKSPAKNSHSRTMSRLQTKIAQNKIKDKIKNRFSSQGVFSSPPQAPLTPVSMVMGSCSPNPACVAENKPQAVPIETTSVAVTTLLSSTPSPVMSARPTTSAVTPVPKAEEVKGEGVTFVKLKRPMDVWSETEAKRRLQRRSAVRTYAFYASEKVHSADLLPMGIDSSDESEVDDLLPWQRNWLLSSSDEESCPEDDPRLDNEELSSNIRKTKLTLHKSKLRRQLKQLCHMHDRNQAKRQHIQGDLRALLASARSSPVCCVRAISATTGRSTVSAAADHRTEKANPCLHRNHGNDVTCSADALPYTNHCSNHVMFNVDQQIYQFCTAKFSDNTQCSVPVLDPHHELALCPEHAAKAYNYEKNHEPRPKKPRKKTKPSALTRPPKKGKKKKNQRRKLPEGEATPPHDPLTSQAPPTSLPAANQQRSQLGAPPTYANATNDMGFLNGVMDKELDLPLEDQATQFLDEHDLHDVLNKLPDEAFDLLAGCADDIKADGSLDRAWAEMSQEVLSKDSSSPMVDPNPVSSSSSSSSSSQEDDLTKQIAVSLLNQNAPLSPSGSIADDHDYLNDLASSLSASDLKNISQVLSGIVDDADVFKSSEVNSVQHQQLMFGFKGGPPPPPPPPPLCAPLAPVSQDYNDC